MRSRVEQFAAIRRDHRVEGLSVRALAEKHHVHRRTVRQALESAIPLPRKRPRRVAPRLERFKAAIDDMLRGDLEAPKKQRHTARRILARLIDEHGAGDLSCSTVRDHVRKRRPEILAEAGTPLELGFVPQTHPPAGEAEVDFHDLWVILRGVKTKTALVTMRLSYSARAAHRAFLTQGQEAFLEGHVHGFARLGGVPLDKIRYDNLTSAVTRVLFGRSRQENERWIAFQSHYGFESRYCQPGHEGSHEKGGVEGEGGRFRRNHCAPMPVVNSLEELNALLQAWDDADDARRVGNRASSVGQDWAVEKTLLRPLPAESFDTALTLTPRVDRYAQVIGALQPVLGAGPVHRPPAAGEAVRVGGHRLRPHHRRGPARTRGRQGREGPRPGPLPGDPAPQTRRPARRDRPGAGARVGGVHRRARRVLGRRPHRPRRPGRNTRAGRGAAAAPPPHRDDVRVGISAALSVGSANPDVVALEARQAAERRGAGTHNDDARAPHGGVVTLAERRVPGLPTDGRPPPSVDKYDILLRRESS